jgi:hypothetical protein
MRRALRHRGWFLIAAPGLLAACAPHAAVACGDVGASSGIQIVYADVLRRHHQAVTVRACVSDVCRGEIVPSGQHRLSVIAFGQQVLHDGTPAAVSLTISGPAGELFRGETVVTPNGAQPNGPDCPPTAWGGQVVATGQHTLKQTPTG